MRIFTWHIHGSYLYNLVQCPHEFYVPVKPDRSEGYYGRTESYAWPENLHEVPAEDVRNLEFDCILFQTRQNYVEDQYEILSPEQRQLPRVYLEHDPPWEHPTNTRHHVDDPSILLAHVTHFNNLIWHNGKTPTKVIEHGAVIPEQIKHSGEIGCGLVLINNLRSRGRLLGLDIFEEVRKKNPLELVRINAGELGGVDSLPHRELLEFERHYRFVFNPIRYTSLGLAVCEVMTSGMPIVGFTTTEMATAIENGVSGYMDTNQGIRGSTCPKSRQFGIPGGCVTRRDNKALPDIYEWTDGIRVIYVPAGPADFVLKENLLEHMGAFTEHMINFFKRRRKPYDLIHANCWMSGLLAADVKAALGIPFVITFHALGRVRPQFQGKDDGVPDQRFEV